MASSVLFIVKVLIFVSVISVACCFHCTVCSRLAGRDECVAQNRSIECTIEEVNRFHRGMSISNNGLPQFDEDMEENATFSCFTIESIKIVRAGVRQQVLVAGCTLEEVEFCEGWSSDVKITQCATCNTTGLCSGAGRISFGKLVLGVSFLGAMVLLSGLFK